MDFVKYHEIGLFLFVICTLGNAFYYANLDKEPRKIKVSGDWPETLFLLRSHFI